MNTPNDNQAPDLSGLSPERVARSREQIAAGRFVGLEALDRDFEPARVGSCADCGLDLYEDDAEDGLCDGCSWAAHGGEAPHEPSEGEPPVDRSFVPGCSCVGCTVNREAAVKRRMAQAARRGPPAWLGWLTLIAAGLAFAGVTWLWWLLVWAAEGA